MDNEIIKILIWAIAVIFWALTNSFSKVIEAWANSISKKIESNTDNDIRKNKAKTDREIVLENENKELVLQLWNKDLENNDDIEEENNQDKDNGTSNFVLVPISNWSKDWNLDNNLYFRQSHRNFREGIKYIWFYHKKEIIWYWEFKKVSYDSIKNKIKMKDSTKYITEYIDLNSDELIFFKISNFKEINVNWFSENWAIQWQKYLNLDNFKEKFNLE